MNAQLKAKLLKKPAKKGLNWNRITGITFYLCCLLAGWFLGGPIVVMLVSFVGTLHPTWWQYAIVAVLVAIAWGYLAWWLFNPKGGWSAPDMDP